MNEIVHIEGFFIGPRLPGYFSPEHIVDGFFYCDCFSPAKIDVDTSILQLHYMRGQLHVDHYLVWKSTFIETFVVFSVVAILNSNRSYGHGSVVSHRNGRTNSDGARPVSLQRATSSSRSSARSGTTM